jgi:type I thyroxine 5'-deiodinase
MAKRYEKDVAFLLVYIREAHPTDGRQAPQNVRQGVLLPTARTMEQKEEHADTCIRKLDVKFPALVDKMDNKVELTYAGWPDRLYLIGKDGRLAYKSRPGPAGFLPAELERAIAKLSTTKF